jgi:hypothetical protein
MLVYPLTAEPGMPVNLIFTTLQCCYLLALVGGCEKLV